MVNPYNPDIHHRRSIRLKGYDYFQSGAYFVTICTHNRECLFGEIVSGEMRLNVHGRIVSDIWLDLPNHYDHVKLDRSVIMPNHFHGIVVIADGRGTACRARTTTEQFGRPVSGSMPTVIRSFKSAVTKRINEMVGSAGHKRWQRNYYEHIIRDDADYYRIAEYIQTNPQQWINDQLHPDYIPPKTNANTKSVGNTAAVGAGFKPAHAKPARMDGDSAQMDLKSNDITPVGAPLVGARNLPREDVLHLRVFHKRAGTRPAPTKRDTSRETR